LRLLGLDLGGTDIKLAVLEGERVVHTDSAPTSSEDGGPPAVLRRIVELGRSAGPIEAIGLAVPGLVDRDGSAVLFPNLYGDWVGQPLAAPLAEEFGRQVALVNDGHAFALAEARVGAARGSADVICVVCGTGVGGGLVLGGRLHLGLEDRAGEIGHHTVFQDGELCGCGNRGCLETIAGSRAIARGAGKQRFADVLEAARLGERDSLAALERAGRMLGLAIANLTIFLTPERIVVGGGVAAAEELVLAPLRDELERRAGSVAPLHLIEVVPAALGPFAGAIGAALHGGDIAVVPLTLIEGGTP
jgi:glucokinase